MFPISQQDCHILFFTKPGCPLCDKAMELAESLLRGTRLRIKTVNILSNPTLYEMYGERIPVFQFPDGRTIEAPMHENDLKRAIRKITG